MTRQKYRAALGALLLFSLAGATHAEGPPNPLLLEMGRVYFQQYCASCHGVIARGDGPSAAALAVRPPDLTRIASRRGGQFPVHEITGIIDGRAHLVAHGTREMPIWGRRLAEAEGGGSSGDAIARGMVVTLVEYLRSLQVPASKAPAD